MKHGAWEPDVPDDEGDNLIHAYRARRLFMGVVSLIVIVALLLLMILGVWHIMPRERQEPSPVRMADAIARERAARVAKTLVP